MRLLVAATVIALAIPSAGRAQERYAAVVEHILDAWKTADVVCLGEDHDRVYDNDLRLALIRHPAFPRTVHAIVVEMANPVHQDRLDRFTLDLAPLTRAELAPIWRDATNPEVWESPLYEQLLRAIQDVNARLPRDQRVRVLGGDSKVDWSRITKPEELVPLMNRGANIREIMATQVLETRLKALAIYGAGHCNRMESGFPGELTGRYGKERFWTMSPLIRRAGVEKGRAIFGFAAAPAYVVIPGSRWAAMPVEDMLIPALARFTFGQLYDAIVYHGDVPDTVVGADMAALKASMGPELDRRARILADAVELRRRK